MCICLCVCVCACVLVYVCLCVVLYLGYRESHIPSRHINNIVILHYERQRAMQGLCRIVNQPLVTEGEN